MTLAFSNLIPGAQTVRESVERRLIWGPIDNVVIDQVILDSTTVDARSTITTELQPGLCLGRITSTKKHKHYAATNTDGSQFEQAAILAHPVNMLDAGGIARDQLATVIVAGPVKQGECGGLDDFFRSAVHGRILFDDDYSRSQAFGGWRDVVAKTADYTVQAADSGRIFTNRGATGAVNFTLPAIAKGLRFRFYCEAAQDLIITAATADTLVVFNDLAADSVTIDQNTNSKQIGGALEIFANDNASKWLVFPFMWNVADTANLTQFTIAT